MIAGKKGMTNTKRIPKIFTRNESWGRTWIIKSHFSINFRSPLFHFRLFFGRFSFTSIFFNFPLANQVPSSTFQRFSLTLLQQTDQTRPFSTFHRRTLIFNRFFTTGIYANRVFFRIKHAVHRARLFVSPRSLHTQHPIAHQLRKAEKKSLHKKR